MFATSTGKILIIDDDEDDYFITSEYIRKIKDPKFEIDWCYRYQDALEHIKNREYDIYFIDYYLGAKTGLNLIQEASGLQVEEPLVLLTGKGNQAIDLEAMQAGAWDYLVKADLNAEKIERCIRYSLERASSLKALRANERKYRTLFERSKDAVFICNRELKFMDLNDATTQLFELDRFELLEKRLTDFLEDDDALMIQAAIQVQGHISDHELEINSGEEDKKTCILSLSTDTNIDGTVTINGMLHDITHLKKAEKATLQAEKLAAAGRLVQTLAHEVRNPLNNINLSTEQLAHDMDPQSDSQIYLDIVQRNSKRIGDIITELLNSSRPTEMALQKVSLQYILDESIGVALDRITLQKIKLQIRYSDEPAFISGDPQKLKIAFLNIIINAIEAMKEGTGQLMVSVGTEGPRYTVKISDNGSGISEENLSRLFEPYFTSKRNGLGLGLAATLNILQSHKAHIDVSSVLEKGTSFTISFPKE